MTDIKQRLEAVRGEIRALNAELTTLTSQTRSRREIDEIIEKQVAAWRAQASAEVATGLQRLVAGQPAELLTIRVQNGPLNLGPWLAAAMGEKAMVTWLKSQAGNLPEGLEATKRAERIAELRREIAQAERAEADLFFEADEMGQPVDLRPDADPRAALIVGFAE